MRYVSNLIAPDLRPYFKLKDPPIQIMGHDIPSDPDFEPGCGFFSDDEAAILYHVAKQVGGTWIDVGARFGWTAAHLMEAGCFPLLIDPHFKSPEHRRRAEESLNEVNPYKEEFVIGLRGTEFGSITRRYCRDTVGIVIDGNHDDPEPLNDAMTAYGELQGEGVILMHDFWGAPIQRAVTWLINVGYKCRIYSTPNGVALCWKMASFIPPDHVPDPACERARVQLCKDFDFTRCV